MRLWAAVNELSEDKRRKRRGSVRVNRRIATARSGIMNRENEKDYSHYLRTTHGCCRLRPAVNESSLFSKILRRTSWRNGFYIGRHDQWSLIMISCILIFVTLTAQARAQITEKFDCRPNGCCDQHEWCAFWASIGECESNNIWMVPNCQLACNTCPQTGSRGIIQFALHTRPHGGVKTGPKRTTLSTTTPSEFISTEPATPTNAPAPTTPPPTTRPPSTPPPTTIPPTTLPPTTAAPPPTRRATTLEPTTPEPDIPESTDALAAETEPVTETVAEEEATDASNLSEAPTSIPASSPSLTPSPASSPTPTTGTPTPAPTPTPTPTASATRNLGSSGPPTTPKPPTFNSTSSPPNADAPVVNLNENVTIPPPIVPTGPKLALGNNPARCEEIRKNNLSNVIQIMRHDGLINDKEDSSFRRVFSIQDIFSSNTQFGCAPQQDFTDCSRNICYNLRYRTMDGSCNNFQSPFFGAAATPFIRLKPPVYDDGIAEPTGTVKGGRPSSRDVSRFLLSSPQLVLSERLNSLMMQFGQFVTHDITKTSLLPTDKCIGCADIAGRCTPIKADPADPRFGCSSPPCCLSFTRSAPVCGTGTNSPRAQLNENTAFLDASMVYGSSITDNNRLRDGILMKTTAFQGHNFLPFNAQQCLGPTNCNANFDAGDNRITIFVGLAAFHTLLLREHNRIAPMLQQRNPQWSADRVFQETRKIIGAVLQAITYKEWLPKVLGSALASSIGPYKGYDEKLNPAIASEFTHAAMRFGHGMIQESYNRLDTSGQPIAQGGMKFDEGVLKPQKLLFEGGIDPILRGMLNMPLKRPQRVTTAVTERMFGSSDLAAINLQRGRDVGLPSYNEWREFCGLKKAQTFDDLSGEILDKNVRTNLQTGYKTTDAIDLYVGSLVEDPVVDGLVGPTLACLIGDQFKRIRDGDRFWYQNPATFTPEQVAEIEKVTFARILCDNADGFQSSPPNAFEVPTGSNGFVPCSSIPTMDLGKWSD